MTVGVANIINMETSYSTFDITQAVSFFTGTYIVLTAVTYFLISPFLSPLLLPKHYPNWTKGKQDFWNSTPFSTVHALSVTPLCLWALLFDHDGTVESQIFMRTDAGTAALQLSLGFFVGDFLVILSSKELRNDYRYIVHHIVSGMSILLGLGFKGHYKMLTIFRLFSELSTPFVNLRWFLEATKMPKAFKLYILCGLLLTVTFYASRIFIMPILWYFLYTFIDYENWPDAKYFLHPFLKTWTVIAYFALDLLNILWAYKIGKGFIKHLSVFKNL